MIIYGKNPVLELLSNPSSQIEEIYISRGSKRNETSDIVETASNRRIKTTSISREEISDLCHTRSHQGIAARVKDFEYSELSDLISEEKKKADHILIIILDHLEDPQNLGAIIRTADVLGAQGVVIPKDRAASVTPAVIKASAGAVNHLPVSRVVNLATVIRELKKEGVWIVGSDSSSTVSVQDQDLKNLDLALIIGNEGKGIAQKIKGECDFLVSIPQSGKVSSLNASVAAGILMYEIVRQRKSD